MANPFKFLQTNKKPKTKGLWLPNFLRTTASGATISDARDNQVNDDLTQIRYGTTTEEIARDYAVNSPDVSHALESTMRFLITDSYTVIAKNLETDIVDAEATRASQMFAARLDKLPITYDGFSPQSSISAMSETVVSQLLTNGSGCMELVLDAQYLPSHFQPISTNSLEYESKGSRYVPFISTDDGDVYLDSSAVKIISLSQNPETPYAKSWYKAAIQSIVSSTEFTNDLRTSFRKASLPRVSAVIDTEKFLASLPTDVLYDQEKLTVAMNSIITDLESKLNGLNPQDAIISFDTVEVKHLTAGNISSHDSVSTHSKIVNGQISTGLHVLPSVLGRGESQTTASTETVLFLKIVESIQNRLNELYSSLFTLAARLQGYDVTVAFEFKKPTLRTEMEDQAFVAMKQSTILQKLSLGFISDEEASLQLTGDLPSGNFTPLSGTGFHNASTETSDNPYSNTSVSGDQLNETADQADRSETDTEPKTNSTAG